MQPDTDAGEIDLIGGLRKGSAFQLATHTKRVSWPFGKLSVSESGITLSIGSGFMRWLLAQKGSDLQELATKSGLVIPWSALRLIKVSGQTKVMLQLIEGSSWWFFAAKRMDVEKLMSACRRYRVEIVTN